MSTKDLIGQAAERKYTEFDIKAKEILLQKLDSQLTTNGYYDKLTSARNVNEATLIESETGSLADLDDDEVKWLKDKKNQKKYKFKFEFFGGSDAEGDITGKRKDIFKALIDGLGYDNEDDIKDLDIFGDED